MQQPVTIQPGINDVPPATVNQGYNQSENQVVPSAPPYPLPQYHPPQYLPQAVPQTQQVANSTTVVMVNQQHNDQNKPRVWSSGLFGCFEDCGSCCIGLFCPMCLLMDISQTSGEGCCFAYCCPGTALLTLRVKIRVENNIQGSLCDDYCVVNCCPQCVMCQLSRELKHVHGRS